MAAGLCFLTVAAATFEKAQALLHETGQHRPTISGTCTPNPLLLHWAGGMARQDSSAGPNTHQRGEEERTRLPAPGQLHWVLVAGTQRAPSSAQQQRALLHPRSSPQTLQEIQNNVRLLMYLCGDSIAPRSNNLVMKQHTAANRLAKYSTGELDPTSFSAILATTGCIQCSSWPSGFPKICSPAFTIQTVRMRTLWCSCLLALGGRSQEAGLQLEHEGPAAALATAVNGHGRAGSCRQLPREACVHAHGWRCKAQLISECCVQTALAFPQSSAMLCPPYTECFETSYMWDLQRSMHLTSARSRLDNPYLQWRPALGRHPSGTASGLGAPGASAPQTPGGAALGYHARTACCAALPSYPWKLLPKPSHPLGAGTAAPL